MFSKIRSHGMALAVVSAACTMFAPPAIASQAFRASTVTRLAHQMLPAVVDHLIYVSDANNRQIYVYPAGVANPSPIETINTSGTPTGMAVAHNGSLFVVVTNAALQQDNIYVYAQGGKDLVGSIGYSNGIMSIRDVAFDSKDNLYVSGIRTSDGSIGVMEFAANSSRAIGWYPSPTQQTYGIVLDARDNLYIDLGFNGTAIEYASSSKGGPYQIVGINGAPSAGGLAFTGANLVMTGGTGLWIYAPSPPNSKFRFTLAGSINYGVGHGTGYLTRGHDGTLYVPVFGNSGGHSTVHEVRVYRKNGNGGPQFATYSTITTGLEYPSGVAVGP